VLAKALFIRLIAVLISGTLGTAPFACCCAAVQSQEIEAFVHPMPAQPMPPSGLPCPHKVTASLDAGQTVGLPVIAPNAKPVVYSEADAVDSIPEWPAIRPTPHMWPPPMGPATLVSQHVLLLI